MDLRAVLNESSGAAGAAVGTKPGADATQPPSRSHAPPAQRHERIPSMNGLNGHSQAHHEQHQPPPHGSPQRSDSYDYGAPRPQPVLQMHYSQPHQGSFSQPSPSRPLQDPRGQYPSAIPPSPSQYRQTSVGPSSNGYPGGPTQNAPISPGQHQGRHPPHLVPQPYQRAGSVGHHILASPVQHHSPHPNGYGAPPPQTPPAGLPVISQQYFSQRSQSVHSASTPTSAHSQHGPPNVFNSPVAANRAPPNSTARHNSQPPTPLGPPPRQGGFVQPTSPYQQRTPSSAGPHPPPQYPTHPAAYPQASPQQRHHQQPPSLPPTLQPQRSDSNSSVYDGHPQPPQLHKSSTSLSDRDRSVSVSPRTRAGSIQSSAGHLPPVVRPVGDHEPRPYHMRHPPQYSSMAVSAPGAQGGPITGNGEISVSGKRKFDERGLSISDIEYQQPRDIDGRAVVPRIQPLQQTRIKSEPPQPQLQPAHTKPRRYAEPPIWARPFDQHCQLRHANYVLKHPRPHSKVPNGKHETRPARQQSPAAPIQQNKRQPSAAPREMPPAAPAVIGPLGRWEPTIENQKPFDQISKMVADFLFLEVVSKYQTADLRSQGAAFEVEAKLGTLTDKHSNERVNFPVVSECVVADSDMLTFRSSMTEIQHKNYNAYLNTQLMHSDPRNPANAKTPRVQINYVHRREVDKFYELPQQLRHKLPDVAQHVLATKRYPPRVRITTDMHKPEVVLASIVKVNLANLNLFLTPSNLDCRISVNLECKWSGSVEELEQYGATAVRGGQSPPRRKDRMSYSQSHYHLDLTQVTKEVPGPNNTTREEKEHELEVELDTDVLIDHGQRALRGDENGYAQLVEGFVDNVRLLARKAVDFSSG